MSPRSRSILLAVVLLAALGLWRIAGRSERPGSTLGFDGEYHLVGVPPGEYELSATTSTVAGKPRATQPLVVREGELEIPVELALGDL